MMDSSSSAAVPPPGKRLHSIAIFGCTGNAGRAVAYHAIKSAARKPDGGVPIALSGRNRDKVERVLRSVRDEIRAEGVQADDVADNVAIIVADASDEESMLKLAKSANVLVNCTGPYWRYGEAAVRACVEGGTHYLDIDGEVAWVERMIGEYGARAEERGVVLCPFSGYDCVPAELGMWLVGKALEAGGGEGGGTALGKLELTFGAKGGGFPRGTLETILDAAEGKQPQRREGDPPFYPNEYRGTAKAAMSLFNWILPKYQLGQFTGPNLMSLVNVPVLCRAAPYLGFSSDISISDKTSVVMPALLNGYGLIPSLLYIVALVVGGISFFFPPFQWWLRGKLQTYSYGGDSSGKTFLDARGISANGNSSATAKCAFPGDPGIYATGLFAAGVAAALYEATLGSKYPMPPAGFHSPVVALHGCREGLLVDHLRDGGASINVKVEEGGGAAREVDASKLRSNP